MPRRIRPRLRRESSRDSHVRPRGCGYNHPVAWPNPIPFDTHRFVKRMTEAGMPAAQAEALADEQVALLNSQLATKEDFADLAARHDGLATRESVAELAARQETLATKAEVAELRKEVAVLRERLGLVLWLISSVGGGVAFLVVRTVWTG